MSMIKISNLTFGYEESLNNLFENVSFNIDTDWKIGLIGKNGKGKTTLLKLLLKEYEYSGSVKKSVEFDYFPFEVKNDELLTIEIIKSIVPLIEDWKIMRELSLLDKNIDILYRSFNTLSGGERVKILLVSLFLKEDNFLLLDEPTNHLDIKSKKEVAKYLKNKKGYIVVSHDREFIDEVVDHILAINNTSIDIQKGNFKSFMENKDKQNNFEIIQNKKLKDDIERLEIASKKTANWSDKVEKSKKSPDVIDKGYVGHMSAKMMQRSKSIVKRKEKMIEEKSKLLKEIERYDDLKIIPLKHEKNFIIRAKDVQIKYENKIIFNKIDFEIKNGERIAIVGKNGSGKSSLLKLILGDKIEYEGTINIVNNLEISYVSQDIDNLKGTLRDVVDEYKIDESIFKAMLSKLGFLSNEFDKNIKEFSEGQKKKILIARSITESKHLYIWDEPLNFIDIISRIQIEEAILKYKPTMIFVEHDETFIKNIATKKVELKREN